LPGKLKTEVFF